MELIQGGKGSRIAGAKIGDCILITLITGKVEKTILSGRDRDGIEAFNLEIKSQPLTFYPYNNILKVTKYNPEPGA